MKVWSTVALGKNCNKTKDKAYNTEVSRIKKLKDEYWGLICKVTFTSGDWMREVTEWNKCSR